MKPLVVLDTYSAVDSQVGAAFVASHHRHTCPERLLKVVRLERGEAVAAVALEAAFADAAGIQLTGSPLMLNTSDTPWQGAVGAALEAAARRGVPVLGVCFGHQLLGQHFGGTLESFERNHWGVAEVALDGGGPFAGLASLPLVFTHKDYVSSPGSMEVVASGGLGGIQALAHPVLPVWTMQAHPEADAALCVAGEGNRWPRRYSKENMDTIEAKAILRAFGLLMAAR